MIEMVEADDAQSAQERRRAILLRNKLINNDVDVAEKILTSARISQFANKSKIIEQGANDECVYFILSGSVEVFVDGRHIDYQSVPNTVGEMAASKPGELRTADVIVQSRELEVMVLSGADFRRLMDEFPNFSANLNDLKDSLLRKKIIQHGRSTDRGKLSWALISFISAALFWVLFIVGLWLFGLTGLPAVLVSLGSSSAMFVVLQLMNPALRYRNMFTASGVGLLALTVYGSFSVGLKIGNKSLPFFLDFSTGNENSGLALQLVALFAMASLSAYFDFKLNERK